RQLFNIGVMGRDTFVQFHPPQDLRTIINDSLKGDVEGPAVFDSVSTDLATAELTPTNTKSAEDTSTNNDAKTDAEVAPSYTLVAAADG
ncbi:hypothetical protein R0J93_24580, partial [Pseudoalteromonas sp. SIMBA_148]